METSILQELKKRAGRFLEPQLLRQGRVLEVRVWEKGTLIEIDLHLPLANMAQWQEVPYIKFRVGDLCFRDYTPFGWDADTQTCTILVDAGHYGPGSSWAKSLRRNDTVSYLKIETTRHTPDPVNLTVGLGDESSLAHLLALQQMTLPHTRFCGAVLMDNAQHCNLLTEYFGKALDGIAPKNLSGYDDLFGWVVAQGFCIEHTVFYLAGNDALVGRLRNLLRAQGYLPGQIKIKGFWS